MIRTILLVMFFMAISTAALAGGDSQICVSRIEDNGILNIRPVEIIANGNPIMWISGGEKKCVEMELGEYHITAQSSDPYDPNDKSPNTWLSKAILIKAEKNQKIDIAVSPGCNDKGYSGSWKLLKQ